MNLLTIGTEYGGSKHLYGCGITSANIFEAEMKRKLSNKITKCISLRGKTCTTNAIISAIKSLISNGKKTIIYYSGHGNHRMTKDGFIEYWDTPSGPIDQIKIGNILSDIHADSFAIVISESCSSEHMVNLVAMKKRFVSIGATLDHQDAIITCDGGLFTMALVETLKSLDDDFKVSEFISSLFTRTIDVEQFSVRYSDNDLLEETMF